MRQLRWLLEDASFRERLVVFTGDSRYSKPAVIWDALQHEHVVMVTRLRNNRVVYLPPESPPRRRRGRPRQYGPRFALNAPPTWPEPDPEIIQEIRSRKGKPLHLRIRMWRNLLMRGTRDCPMYRYPFTLISYELLTPEGKPLFRRPVWLAVFGPRRGELSPQTLVQLYMRRFDIEHCFRFCKRNLLLTASQTPKVNHEEHWADLVLLAYTQLWLARELAQALRQP